MNGTPIAGPAGTDRPRVALARCSDYADSQAAIRPALELLGPADLFRGKRVLLKVNLMKGAQPAAAVNTHPEFVAALVRLVVAEGGEALVGDSTGVLGCTDEAFAASGIAEAVRAAGGRIVNFDACEMAPIELIRWRHQFWVPRILFDVDLLVTVPKLKTHTLTLLTGAVKNQVGALAGGQKCRIHQLAPRPSQLAQLLLDLHAALPVKLAVVDGIVALAGQGMGRPAQPQPLGAVVAGRDLIAVDAVCARLIGIEPAEVLTCRYGQERGLGVSEMRRIELLDPDGLLPAAAARPFARPGFDPKRIGAFARFFYRLRGGAVRPALDAARCARCGRCAQVCPTRAITLRPYPRIGAGCILCFACHENCPHQAMRLRCKRLLRRSFRKRAAEVDVAKLFG